MIHAGDVSAVASEACAALDRVGCVDVIERGEAALAGLEEWFGSPLFRQRLNETQLDQGARVDLDDMMARATQSLVNDRCAADLEVWSHVFERRERESSQAIVAAEYGATLVRVTVGNVASPVRQVSGTQSSILPKRAVLHQIAARLANSDAQAARASSRWSRSI